MALSSIAFTERAGRAASGEISPMNRLQIQLGFVLILLALCTGFGMPLFMNPRLGLAAHIVGITGGLVLIVLGALAGSFALGSRAAAVIQETRPRWRSPGVIMRSDVLHSGDWRSRACTL